MRDIFKILIVDDEPEHRTINRRLLHGKGYDLYEAETGQEGLRMAQSLHPDLVLLDAVLPDISGFQVCRNIKSDPDLRDTFVILISSVMTSSDQQAEGLESGADGYIVRPVEKRELLARIEGLLRLRKVQKELLESEKRLRRAEMVAQFGNWELELKTGKVRLSEGARALYGLEGDEWPVDELRKIALPEYRTLLEDELHALIQDGRPYCLEFKIRRPPDGRILDIHSIAQYSAEKGIVFGVIQDITARKKAEEEKERLESQLRQAQKLEAIGKLAGGIAHDFNNILGAILGYTEMALQEIPENTLPHEDLQQVFMAAIRAKDLTSQILSFSRQQEARAHRPLEIAPPVKDALRLLRAILPTTIELRQTISPDPMMINGDSTQLHQIVMNLCTNAAHAMRETGGTLEVSLGKVDMDVASAEACGGLKPGSHALLTIKDTGHGMDAITLERIFDPYFTTKEVGEGSGLGLSVVRGIVKRHAGAVRTQSAPGAGTVFEILFPMIERQEERPEKELQIFLGGGEHILFVDDEEALAVLGRRMLSSLGYRVTTKMNSPEALELFRLHPETFDLVITDFTMPHMTGMDLARKMLRVRPDMPIVLCTGYSEMINEKAARKAGIRSYIMKPIVMNTLAQTVHDVLAHSRSQGGFGPSFSRGNATNVQTEPASDSHRGR